MYNLRFDASDGRVLRLVKDNGIIITSVAGATGIAVSLSLAQGYQQIGQSITTKSVGGVTLTISGEIINGNTAAKRLLMSVFAPFVTGRLWWDDIYYMDVAVKNTPTVGQTYHSAFMFQVFSSSPYWAQGQTVGISAGAVTPEFSFPVTYTTGQTHTFGTASVGSDFNVYNAGDVESPIDVTVMASGPVTDLCLTNARTLSRMQFSGTLLAGETLRLYQQAGKIRIKHTDVYGVETEAYSWLSDESDLFALSVGDNILSISAASGLSYVRFELAYNNLFVGVLQSGT